VTRSDLSTAPTGEQHLVEAAGRRLIVTELGATMRSYSVGDVEILDGFDRHEMSSAGRGQILAPWPNRLEDGRYVFGDREGVAQLDEPDRGNAIHGLVRRLPWRAVERSEARIVLGCDLRAQPAYPWDLDLEVSYELSDEGLTVVARATNRSAAPAPFGIGFHPYLTVGTDTVDDVVLTVPARTRLLTNERALPIGDEAVAGTPYDLSGGRRLGSIALDTAFTDLSRSEADRAEVVLVSAAEGRALTLWVDATFTHLMVFTGDTLEPESRRRRGIAIEPMTCPPNAFRSGTDLIALEPGGSWRGAWGIRDGGS
jgi:aldose 1-epimerase